MSLNSENKIVTDQALKSEQEIKQKIIQDRRKKMGFEESEAESGGIDSIASEQEKGESQNAPSDVHQKQKRGLFGLIALFFVKIFYCLVFIFSLGCIDYLFGDDEPKNKVQVTPKETKKEINKEGIDKKASEEIVTPSGSNIPIPPPMPASSPRCCKKSEVSGDSDASSVAPRFVINTGDLLRQRYTLKKVGKLKDEPNAVDSKPNNKYSLAKNFADALLAMQTRFEMDFNHVSSGNIIGKKIRGVDGSLTNGADDERRESLDSKEEWGDEEDHSQHIIKFASDHHSKQGDPAVQRLIDRSNLCSMSGPKKLDSQLEVDNVFKDGSKVVAGSGSSVNDIIKFWEGEKKAGK